MLLLSVLTFLIMGITTYAFWREGLLTSVATLINVMIAGLTAFNFFEPLANELESMVRGSFLHGYEDCLALVVLFTVALGLLRLIANQLSKHQLEYPPLMLQGGKVVCALVTGYLVAGFLSCAFMTMPWPQKQVFGDFDPTSENRNRLFPPDRVWLAMMHRAGKKTFSRGERPTFDPHGNFELRYHRHRHYKGTDKKNVAPADKLLPSR